MTTLFPNVGFPLLPSIRPQQLELQFSLQHKLQNTIQQVKCVRVRVGYLHSVWDERTSDPVCSESPRWEFLRKALKQCVKQVETNPACQQTPRWKYLPVQVATASKSWCWHDPRVNIVHSTHTQKWHHTREQNKNTGDWWLLGQKMAPGPNENPTQTCIKTWKSQKIY